MMPSSCWLIGFPPMQESEIVMLLQEHCAGVPVHSSERFSECSAIAEDALVFLWDSPVALGMLHRIFESNPRMQVVVLADKGDSDRATEMMRMGIIDYRLLPIPENVWPCYFGHFTHTRELTKQAVARQEGHREFLTKDINTVRLLDQAALIAPSRASVLICGESGTGKERMARFIHKCSDRKEGTFLGINCAAIPEGVLEAELFGYEKGAFTGAVESRPGKFELAHQGTLLLDEITEMPIHLQAKLLRVLQEGEVDRIGGRSSISVNVRIIATTNRNLERCVQEGGFREDLYFRLNVVSIVLPPLRDRPKDILYLADHFLDKYAEEYGVSPGRLDESAAASLLKYPWPGNVRELENMMHRLTLLFSGKEISAKDLTFPASKLSPASNETTASPMIRPGMSIRDMEKALICETLEHVRGNRTEAARLLGISTRTLRNKLKAFEDGTALA